MSYSTQRAVSLDGMLALLDIEIEYFGREEISVYFDSVQDAHPWNWVGTSEHQIAFSPPVPIGVEVLVKRSTDISQPRHVFNQGAAFEEAVLDEVLLQTLHIAQEARENATIEEVFTNMNMHGYRITNVGDPVSDLDVVNKRAFTSHDATIVGYMNTTKGYKDAAAASAAAALVSENNAAAEVADHVALADPHTQYVLEADLASTAAGKGGELVAFKQAGAGAVATDVQRKLRVRVSVWDFIPDGTDPSAVNCLPYIQAAVSYMGARGGGEVWLDPVGKAYRIDDSLSLPNGVVLAGSLARGFAGATATNAQWSATGSWLNPTHVSNPAVRLQGHGSGVSGICFIHNQTEPSGGSWSPTTYGWCIQQETSHSSVEDVLIVNASHGVYMKYTTVSGGGTDVRWRNLAVSAFVERLRTSNVNDTAYWSNIHCRNLWYSSDSRVVTYIRANTKGWRCGYTDNIMVDGIEFFEDAVAMYFEDETCLGNTHSLYNATLSNVQFNLPQVCMKVATPITSVSASLTNAISQTGNAFGYTWADTAFQLGSDNVNMKFNGLTVREAGGQVFTIGGGAGGKVVIDNFDIEKYSSAGAGQIGIAIGAGALLRLANYRIVKLAGAGMRFAGAGLENVSTDAYGQILFFGRLGEASTTGNGSYQDLSTSSYFRPGQARAHQARLMGELNVITAQAAATANVRTGNGLSELAVTGIDASTTGWKSFDTGWVDLLETTLTALSMIGRIQVQAKTGVVMSNGSIQVLYR